MMAQGTVRLLSKMQLPIQAIKHINGKKSFALAAQLLIQQNRAESGIIRKRLPQIT